MMYYELPISLREPFEKKRTRAEVDELLFMWVKSGHITKKQFQALNAHSAMLHPYINDDPDWD